MRLAMTLRTLLRWVICLKLALLAQAQDTIVVTTITEAPAQPTNEPTYVDDGAFRDAVLNSTNFFRQEHNASALAWNDSLSDFGRDYADRCLWQHSGGPHGENLAQGYANISAAVDAWGNERQHYDFSRGDFSESTGHFTQLVWKGSRTVGCGRTFCNGRGGVSGYYLVCEYLPRGNVIGSFQANVQAQASGGEPGSSQSSVASTLSPTGTQSATSSPSVTASRAWRLLNPLGLLGPNMVSVALVACLYLSF